MRSIFQSKFLLCAKLIILSTFSERPVSEEEAADFASGCGAACYVECSALTQKNLKQVFDSAIVEALEFREQMRRKRKKSWKAKKSFRKSHSAEEKAIQLRRKSVAWWKKALCFA